MISEREMTDADAGTEEPVVRVDRFDFEQLLLRCWAITDDISDVSTYLGDASVDVKTHDEVMNMLIGLEHLYNVRFNRLFEMFEQLVKQHKL